METETISLIDETTALCEATIERIRKQTLAVRRQLESWAADMPQSKACEHHNHVGTIEWDASVYRTMMDAENTLVYSPCPGCADVAKLQLEGRWMLDRGVPPKLVHAAFSNYRISAAPEQAEQDRGALAAAMEFPTRRNRTLILVGNLGRGKSHLAVAIMRAKKMGRFIKQDRLMVKLSRQYGGEGEDVIRWCETAKLLVLDELGVSRGGADVGSSVHTLISYRYDEDIPTIITANQTLDQFRAFMGERLLDRLKETARIFEFTGPSHRQPLIP